jgi:amino acid adenylation domain-containing protein
VTEKNSDLTRLPGEQRAALLARLGSAGKRAQTLRTVPRTDAMPLSGAQEPLWFLDQLAPGRSSYNCPVAYRLRGPLDLGALRGALADLAARHEILRTSLHEHHGTGVQRIHPVDDLPPIGLRIVELALPAALADARSFACQPFDLRVAPLWRARLYRVGPDDHLLVVVLHHIVFDGTSMDVMDRDLGALYRSRLDGSAPPEPLAAQYADYAAWHQEWLRSEAPEQLATYWRKQLASLSSVEFPTDRPRPAQLSNRGHTMRRALDPAVADGVRRLAAESGVSPYVVYLTAFLILLHRYTGQEDLVVGSPWANRGRAETEPMIGYFVNMLVLRVEVAGDLTVRALLRRVRDVVREAQANGELPFEKVVEAVRPPRDASRTPLFGIGFGLLGDGAGLDLPGIEASTDVVDLDSSRFDLSWNVVEGAQTSRLQVEFSTDLYDLETVDALGTHFENLLRAMAKDDHATAARIPLVGERERAELLRRWNGAIRPARRVSIAELFAEQVRRSPDAIAIVVGGQQVGYDELNRRANRLARLLTARGAGRHARIALCLPRELDLIVAVLAVLKTGAAYVPLDTGNPMARMSTVLNDAAPMLVLTDTALADRLPAGAPLVLLDTIAADLAQQSDVDATPVARPEDAAYVIYTSGTTGTPKGVPIDQHSVVSFIGACRELFALTPADRVLGFASVNFDVSVFEMFAALLIGAQLCLARDAERLDIAALQRLIEDTGVTVTDLPPPVMALLDPDRFPALRIVFVGGEAFSAELVNRWNRGRRLFNGYGPTECTVTMVVQECPGHWDSTPPIGLPMANHVAHVVDRYLEPVPYGVAGELVIGGAGLTRGYLNAPELTVAKIVADPFGNTPGGRLYHTGDLVKRRRDGAIVFLGRIDQQVKIRGLRVELGEIETVLAAHPSVGQVAVGPWTDEAGEKHLAAYVSPAPGQTIDADRLREHVATHLPRYMVPTYVVVLERLTLNASGKVDRRALPDPAEDSRGTVGAAEPTTDTERVLAGELFAELLRLPRVGIHDNFFELGGNSLQATRLMSRIRDRFGVEVGLGDFFQSPTVAHIAAAVDHAMVASLNDDDLLALIEAMPEEQAARLLDMSEG